MTDYSKKKSGKKSAFRFAVSWQAVVGIFLCVFLGLFIMSGFLKAFSLKSDIARSKWDSRVPFVAAVSTSPPSVLVFNRDIGQFIILSLPKEVAFPLGQGISDNGGKLAKSLSTALGVDIPNYITLKTPKAIDKSFLEMFSNPLKMFLVGLGGDVKSTNIGRVDLIRLWWQIKGIGLDLPKTIDLAGFMEGKSLNRELFHMQLDKYFQANDILEQNIKVEVINSSGRTGAGQLAGEIATAAGFNVTRVRTGEGQKVAKCEIWADERARGVSYLANVFGCDIVGRREGDQGAVITVNLGSDFN